jgi:hypothetical protein
MNKKLTEKIFDAFAAKLLENMTWDFKDKGEVGKPAVAVSGAANVARKISGLEERPHFAAKVILLKLQKLAYMACFRPFRYHKMPTEQIVASIQIVESSIRVLILNNIMAENTRSTGYNHDLFDPILATMKMPCFEALTIQKTSHLNPNHFITLIMEHKQLLMTVNFLDITIDGYRRRSTDQPAWIRLLKASASIRSEGVITVSSHQVSIVAKLSKTLSSYEKAKNQRDVVCFTPPADDPSAGTLYHESYRAGYVTKPGHLSKAVGCLVRNYKEIRTDAQWIEWRKQYLKEG